MPMFALHGVTKSGGSWEVRKDEGVACWRNGPFHSRDALLEFE